MASDAAAIGVAHFKVVRDVRGQFHWELFNPQGTAMGRSMGDFDTEDEAVANAEYAQGLIDQLPIIRSQAE